MSGQLRLGRRGSVTCPDCAGRGCRHCSESGRWIPPGVEYLRSVAALLRAASHNLHLAREYESVIAMNERTEPSLLERTRS